MITLKDTYDSDQPFYSRFSCLDVCSDRKILISGDSSGFLHWMPSSESNKTVSNNKHSLQMVQIHSSNILHTEFNKFNRNVFITASIDCTAKLWDIRMFGNKCVKPVLTIRRTEPLNSATFSSTNGSTLLVTDHCDEISVYRGPNWQLESCIRHNHQQTLRFCLLKPVWHPISDIFVIGSFSLNPLVSGQYLDRPQTIDIFDAKKGVILKRISDGHSGVITMSSFNSCGDVIAGIRGRNLIIFESKIKN